MYGPYPNRRNTKFSEFWIRINICPCDEASRGTLDFTKVFPCQCRFVIGICIKTEFRHPKRNRLGSIKPMLKVDAHAEPTFLFHALMAPLRVFLMGPLSPHWRQLTNHARNS
jgi:hypothetical protein